MSDLVKRFGYFLFGSFFGILCIASYCIIALFF